jgi:hypothetical protein
MALRFHPDKALANCRFAERLSAAGAPLAGARAIRDSISGEANWLFHCIGEANSVLADSAKRAQVPPEPSGDWTAICVLALDWLFCYSVRLTFEAG